MFILRQGMTVVFSGVVLGVVLAFLLGRALSRFLYGVSGSDLVSIGGAAVVLLGVAFVACYLPARSASRTADCLARRVNSALATRSSGVQPFRIAVAYPRYGLR